MIISCQFSDYSMDEEEFFLEKHERYFQSCLNGLPEPYVELETSRLTAIYFSVVGLAMLGRLDSIEKQKIVDYVKGMLIHSETSGDQPISGFIGSSYLGHAFGTCEGCSGEDLDLMSLCSTTSASIDTNTNTVNGKLAGSQYFQGHLAQTFSALATLRTLGESFEKLPKNALVRQIALLQRQDGGFSASLNGCECDLRFVYCACAISSLLDDWSGVDKNRACSYIKECISYDGGMALTPAGSEGQGGATYCGIASLALMGRLDYLDSTIMQRLSLWILQRAQEEGGYNGRVNKTPDSCYSFWVGGSSHILGSFDDVDREPCRSFLLYCCQNDKIGGFSKTPGVYPDILHSFYSIAWLSLDDCEHLGTTLRPIDVLKGICL